MHRLFLCIKGHQYVSAQVPHGAASSPSQHLSSLIIYRRVPNVQQRNRFRQYKSIMDYCRYCSNSAHLALRYIGQAFSRRLEIRMHHAWMSGPLQKLSQGVPSWLDCVGHCLIRSRLMHSCLKAHQYFTIDTKKI